MDYDNLDMDDLLSRDLMLQELLGNISVVPAALLVGLDNNSADVNMAEIEEEMLFEEPQLSIQDLINSRIKELEAEGEEEELLELNKEGLETLDLTTLKGLGGDML